MLVATVEEISSQSLSSTLKWKFDDLAKIDPDHPLADEAAGQTLSMFGREDLIAATSDDYKASNCTPLLTSTDVLGEIETRARKTSIVIINESHERSEHRGFTAELESRLRLLGYDTLALETLTNNPPATPEQYQPTFLKQPALPYLVDEDGVYLSEAGFGRLGRRAKALGYRLLSYEFNYQGEPAKDLTSDQRIAAREEGQAANLAAFVLGHPAAKLLIHVGYSHAAEAPRLDGAKWMAARLKEKTGIDPLTISQTTCRGGGAARRFDVLPTDQPPGTFDLVLDHPKSRFSHSRPEWRERIGDVAVSIPSALRPAKGWRVIEARPVGEPTASIPMDRVAIRHADDVALMLPPGRYSLRVVDVAPAAAQ
jgi:hypothetical protein